MPLCLFRVDDLELIPRNHYLAQDNRNNGRNNHVCKSGKCTMTSDEQPRRWQCSVAVVGWTAGHVLIIFLLFIIRFIPIIAILFRFTTSLDFIGLENGSPTPCLIVFGIALNGLAGNFDFFTCIATETSEALCRVEGHNPTNYGEKYSNGTSPIGYVD